jgi:predicted Zn-dependent peptidase
VEFRERTLANGLEIIAECNPQAYSTALGFFVKTGSRDETDEISGVSHFLEHMVFKGTAKRSAADVNRELDEMGSFSNAQTGEERTIYYATVLPEFQDRTLELLADILRPALREEDFETEKKVIIEEISMYEDQPPFGGHEKCMAAHFGPHPLGKSILGTVNSVGNLTAAQMRAYFEQRYSPRNITLVAAGNVDFERLVAQAEACCGLWQPFDAPRETPRAPRHSGLAVFPKENATQQYVIEIANGPAAGDDDRYAARALATILGDDSGSRFFWELLDTGRAEYAAIGAYEFQGTGILMKFFCCAPEETAENLQIVRKIEMDAERTGVTEAELSQAKSKICSHVVLQSERPSSRLFAVGVNWLQRREYLTVREIVNAYQAVSRADVSAVLAKYPLSECTTVAVGPLAELAIA